MTGANPEYVITSLQRQLSSAALHIAVLEAKLMEVGAQPPSREPLLVVPDDPEAGSAGAPDGALD